MPRDTMAMSGDPMAMPRDPMAMSRDPMAMPIPWRCLGMYVCVERCKHTRVSWPITHVMAHNGFFEVAYDLTRPGTLPR